MEKLSKKLSMTQITELLKNIGTPKANGLIQRINVSPRDYSGGHHEITVDDGGYARMSDELANYKPHNVDTLGEATDAVDGAVKSKIGRGAIGGGLGALLGLIATRGKSKNLRGLSGLLGGVAGSSMLAPELIGDAASDYGNMLS